MAAVESRELVNAVFSFAPPNCAAARVSHKERDDFLNIDGSFVREILGVRGGAASAGGEVGCCLRGEGQPH